MDQIEKTWKLHSNGKNAVTGATALEIYQDLYRQMGSEDGSRDELDAIRHFCQRNRSLNLAMRDIEYLHDKLTGKSLVDALVLAEEQEPTEDECQVLYSPHKKVKSEPVVEDGDDAVARNIFGAERNGDDPDVEEDFSVDAKASKAQRIAQLEKVLLELQHYTRDLDEFNTRELQKLKGRYEARITKCEVKVTDVGNRLQEFQHRQAPDPWYSLRPATVRILKRCGIYLVMPSITLISIYAFAREIAAIGPMALAKIYAVMNVPREESPLDTTLKEFAHLVELVT